MRSNCKFEKEAKKLGLEVYHAIDLISYIRLRIKLKKWTCQN